MGSPKKFWTDERIAKVRELAPQMSAWMIAQEVGAASRMAVVGLCYREGIDLIGGDVSHRPRGRKTQGTTMAATIKAETVHKSRESPQRAAALVQLVTDIARNPELTVPPPAPKKRGLVPLWELENRHCRSIEGHAGRVALYCGEPKAHGTSWCDGHARRFVPGMFTRG